MADEQALVELQNRVAALESALAKLQEDFTAHFHEADELHEPTDPPIVPVKEWNYGSIGWR
jgi:hypothetical protein